eukprot:Hpha_TRINITY_DN16643_c0_g11::TRINITY_DN16643_c0_g11_i1::g.181901::m.181901/K03648/UNG, UDG; uracil-DNA glycosylase
MLRAGRAVLRAGQSTMKGAAKGGEKRKRGEKPAGEATKQRRISSFFSNSKAPPAVSPAPSSPETPVRPTLAQIPIAPSTPPVLGDTPAAPSPPSAPTDAAPATPVATTPSPPSPASPDLPLPSDSGVAELIEGLRDPGWREALAGEFEKDYFKGVADFVAKRRKKGKVFPPAPDVFTALNETPPDKVRVVILGQDPYHDVGQAHGLCFSVRPGVKPPPSLKNMYKELAQDIPGFEAPAHGFLIEWARQGVLLLNATLTVDAHQANSHKACGWQKFTDAIIAHVSARCHNVVFMHWGGFAQKKGKIVDRERHVVLETAHPSPLSVTKWRNCRVFSKCNAELERLGRGAVNWNLTLDATQIPAHAPVLPVTDHELCRALSSRGLAATLPLPERSGSTLSRTSTELSEEELSRLSSTRTAATGVTLPSDTGLSRLSSTRTQAAASKLPSDEDAPMKRGVSVRSVACNAALPGDNPHPASTA